MKKIAIVTATRAEYGLLKPVIEGLISSALFDIEIVVTGAHLSPDYGLTYKEIENDGFRIAQKIFILDSSDTPAGISRTMGNALIGFGEYFERSKPDLLILLGDRYETAAIASAAVNARVPIAHLHGGETTEGAVDEAYRHAITKMSYLHFTSTEEYRKRVIQLGEAPERVFVVGATGVENAMHAKLLSKEALEESISFKLDKPYASVTFHPVTLEDNTAETQTRELFNALAGFPDMKFIITKANADEGGKIINVIINEYVSKNANMIAFESLGMVRYLSILKYASLVIGNSSSGIIEAPFFRIPTINIGDRQKGRTQAASVINCEPKKESIIDAIKLALSDEWLKKAQEAVNPYGDGYTSKRIVKIIIEAMEKPINLKKKFHDIDFEV